MDDLMRVNLAEPLGEPTGPAMMVPVKVFFRGVHSWTLDFAARCQFTRPPLALLSAVQVEPTARIVAGCGAFVNVSDVLGELRQGARYLSLLLRDGRSARDIANRVHAHIGEHGVEIAGAMGFCGGAGAALLLAAQHAEQTLQASAASELAARGALSEMG